MEKFWKILRITLRKIYVALGVTAMPFLVHAMHGMREPDPDSLTVPLRGRVVSEETGEPIAGIYVWYDRWTSADSDNDGQFFFYLPEANTYTIRFVDKDGFENNGFFTEKNITVTRDEIGDSLKINLYRESNVAIIRGTVLSKETGDPVSGIRIAVFSYANESGVGFSTAGFEVSSDDTGQFYIQVPERNTYNVRFHDPNGLFQVKGINVTADEIKNLLTVDLEKR